MACPQPRLYVYNSFLYVIVVLSNACFNRYTNAKLKLIPFFQRNSIEIIIPGDKEGCC